MAAVRVDESRGVTLPAARTVRDLVAEHGGHADGAVLDRVVTRVVSPEQARAADDLVLLTSWKRGALATASPGVVLCRTDLQDRLGRAGWAHEHALWVVARLLAPFAGDGDESGPARAGFVDPSAVVHPSARVRPSAVVLAGAVIGERTVVGESALVYGRVRLGARVVVGPLSVIGGPGFGWAAGPGGEVVRMPHPGGVVVEDDVEIGALCTVDAGVLGATVLRRGVKLDAHVHVAHNVEIGEGTLVAAQSGFAGSTRIGAGVLVGGQAGVTDHVEVGAGARIGAKSGVIGDVAPGVTVAGFPAMPRMRWLRAWASLLGGRRTRR